MPVTCKPLGQGLILPNILEAVVPVDNKPHVSTSFNKFGCSNYTGSHLGRKYVSSKYQDVCLPLIGQRWEVHGPVGLPL